MRGQDREPGPVPTDILSPEALAAYEAAMAEREEKAAARKARRSSGGSDHEGDAGGD
jgi:hypothetical protein